jgi:hypothetical protein
MCRSSQPTIQQRSPGGAWPLCEALEAKYGLPTQAPRRLNANDMAPRVKLAAMTLTQSDAPAESTKPEQTNVQSALPSQTDNSSIERFGLAYSLGEIDAQNLSCPGHDTLPQAIAAGCDGVGA